MNVLFDDFDFEYTVRITIAAINVNVCYTYIYIFIFQVFIVLSRYCYRGRVFRRRGFKSYLEKNYIHFSKLKFEQKYNEY